ncbi:MAG: hypothetical protein SO062_01460 [Sodaliphilus sp.]|nr:hypothetical protein [Sodaliphilus sp.]
MNGIKNKNIKNSLDCALCVIGNEFPCRHTIPPPPSYEGSPHCTKDKNRSPFHGEKPLIIK